MHASGVQTLLMSGHSKSGKTTVLKKYADSKGLIYRHVDCLFHLDLTALSKLIKGFKDDTPAANYPYQLIELTNFEKFGMVVDLSSGG